MKYLHYTFFILTLIWIGIIFYFSAMNGDDSQAASDGIVSRIVSILIPDLDQYAENKQTEIFDTASLIVRKCAHFTEYAILAVFTFFTCITYIWKKIPVSTNKATLYEAYRHKRNLLSLCSIIFCCIYAMSDEFHQGFVADRAPGILDVIIDTTGSIGGIIFSNIILFFIFKKNKNSLTEHLL